MLGSLRAKRLNRQNASTSYYDFLTCDRECLESLDCKKKQFDDYPEEKRIPPPTLSNLIKYFDVDDKATEWYLGTKRSPPNPCTKKFCFKFRPPIRHIANRMCRQHLANIQCQRISPEFLCLLHNYHQRLAKRSPIYQLPKRLLTGKPSLSYYKYQPGAKSRHMRPGIDTAAPIDFSCKNMTCPRRNLTAEEIANLGCKEIPCCDMLFNKPLEIEPDVDPFCHHYLGTKHQYKKSDLLDTKGKRAQPVKLFLEQNTCLTELDAEKKGAKKSEDLTHRLHVVYDSNNEFKMENELSSDETSKMLHRLYDANPYATQVKIKDSREKLHQIFVTSRNVIPKEPQKKVSHFPDMTDYCPVPKPKFNLGPCDKLICPKCSGNKKDPRFIEYRNSPFYKVLQESNHNKKCTRRKCCKKAKNSTSAHTTEEDDTWEACNWTKSLDKEERQERADNERTGYRVRPDDPHRFFDAIAGCSKRVLVRRSRRPNLYDQNDIEMPPKHKPDKCGYGFTGFIHHSEKQKINAECHVGMKNSCKRKKPPPYCYFWSAVDPDIRNEERTRLAEIDCQNKEKCNAKSPTTYFWSKVPHNKRIEGKKRLAASRASVIEKQKRRVPLLWSREAHLPNEKSSADKRKRSYVRHGSVTSQSSRRSSQLSMFESDRVESVPRRPPTFRSSHAKQHSSYYLWSKEANKIKKELKSKKKSPEHIVSDGSSNCSCCVRSSSSQRKKSQSNASQCICKDKPKMNRKIYASDKESDKELRYMWSDPISCKHRQCLTNTTDGEETTVATCGLQGVHDSGTRIFKKPRILPNLHAVVRHFFFSSKKSGKHRKSEHSENENTYCIKTHKNKTGSDKDHEGIEILGKLTEEDENNFRPTNQKCMGMDRIRMEPPKQSKNEQPSTSQYGQTKGPRDLNLWSGPREKREKSKSLTIIKPKRVSKTDVASSKVSIKEKRRSATLMSADSGTECCKKSCRTKPKKCTKTTTYPSAATATTTCDDEEQNHREPYSFRNRRIQYRNYTGPEPKLNTRYGQRHLSRSRSPCYSRSGSPQVKRKRVSTLRRKRHALEKPCSHTSLASDGYHSPTYSAKEYPCLAAKQKESRAQREWEERQHRRQKKKAILRQETPKKKSKCRTSHLTDERSNDWFLTSRAAEPRTKKCRRGLVLTKQSKQFPGEPTYWQMVQPSKDLGRRRKHKDFHLVKPSNVDVDAYLDFDRKCSRRPDMAYVKTAEENISDGDEDDDSYEGCSCADYSKVPDIYDLDITCPFDQKTKESKKKKQNRIRGGVDCCLSEKSHGFVDSMASYQNKRRMQFHEVNDNKNTNWAHSFCF